MLLKWDANSKDEPLKELDDGGARLFVYSY